MDGFDPLDREILERSFDDALAAAKDRNLSSDFDSDDGLEAILRRELIEIACCEGVSDPEILGSAVMDRTVSSPKT
jgi:hypothetical protein